MIRQRRRDRPIFSPQSLLAQIGKIILDAPRHPLGGLLALVFLVQFGTGLVWSIVAVYAGSLGASSAAVGFLVSSFAGIRLIINVPTGLISERVGRRRMLRIGCAFIAGGSLAAAAVSQFWPLYAAIIIMGIGSGIYVTSALASVIDLGRPDRRIQNLAAYQMALLTGMSLGPGFGGIIAHALGFRTPFLIQCAIASLMFFLVPGGRSNERGDHEEKASSKGALVALLRDLADIWVMVFAMTFARVSATLFLLPLIAIARFRLDVATIGIIITSGSLASLACLPFVAGITRSLGTIWTVLGCSAIAVIAALLMAFGDRQVFLWLGSIVFGVSGGIATPVLSASVAERATPDRRGAAMGLLRTATDAGLILGPLVLGLSASHFTQGYTAGLIICALVVVVATLSFVAIRSTQPRSSIESRAAN